MPAAVGPVPWPPPRPWPSGVAGSLRTSAPIPPTSMGRKSPGSNDPKLAIGGRHNPSNRRDPFLPDHRRFVSPVRAALGAAQRRGDPSDRCHSVHHAERGFVWPVRVSRRSCRGFVRALSGPFGRPRWVRFADFTASTAPVGFVSPPPRVPHPPQLSAILADSEFVLRISKPYNPGTAANAAVLGSFRAGVAVPDTPGRRRPGSAFYPCIHQAGAPQ
jgi:hypothetical protein